mgnify:CR=1 FL=1
MLSKIIKPKTKAELIQSLQSASIKSVEVYEGDDLKKLPNITKLIRDGVPVVILR